MMDGPTGRDLREAALRLGLRQKDIAGATGLSIRTINRLFNAEGPADARPATIEAVSSIVGLAAAPRRRADPLLAIGLPLGTLSRAADVLPGLNLLSEIARQTRESATILGRMTAQYGERMSVVLLRGGELYFEWIGRGIRWSSRHIEGARALDLPDSAVAHAATERYWKALLTGDPVLQYIRTPLGLEFTALTVATDANTRPRLISVTALGRPPLAGSFAPSLR